MKKINLFLAITFFMATPFSHADLAETSHETAADAQAFLTASFAAHPKLKKLYTEQLNELKANYADKIAEWRKQNISEEDIERALEDGAFQEALREYNAKDAVETVSETKLAPAKNLNSAS